MATELLEVIESIQAQSATVDSIFRGEGRSVAAGRRQADPTYPTRLAEFATLLADVVSGKRDVYFLKEAMGISDFPLMFGDVLERTLLANYREWPVTYPSYVAVREVRDFRDVKEFTLDGAESTLDIVPPQTEYPESALTEADYSWAVKKYGRAMPFAWEAIINDDLDALTDIPTRLGRAARRTEEKFAASLFVDVNGPHASLYTGGNANIVTGNPVLSIAALQTALGILYAQTDADGEPIYIEAVQLVVPPALAIVANSIVNTVEYRVTDSTGNTRIIRGNGLGGTLGVSVNPYIPQVASTANGNTSWFLFPSTTTATRPVLRMGFLRGHREPEIFMKEPNQRRVGGGPSSPMDGDFDTDSLAYKVRQILGGRRLDPKGSVASNGSAA